MIYRTHPYTAVDFVFGFSLVAAASFVRRLVSREQSTSAAAMELAVLLLILTLAFLKCGKTLTITHDKLFIEHRRPVTLKRSVDRKNIVMLSERSNPFMRIFNVKKFTVFPAYERKNGTSFFFTKNQGGQVIRNLIEKPFDFCFKCKNKFIIISAFAGTDTLSGIILFAAAVNKAGKILGEEYVYGALNNINRFHLFFIAEPLLAAVSSFIILATAFAVIYRLVRNYGFSVSAGSKTASVSGGAVIKRKDYVFLKNVSFLQTESSFLQRCINCITVKLKFDLKPKVRSLTLVPAMERKDLKKLLSVFTEYSENGSQCIELKPRQTAVFGFSLLPCAVLFPTVLILLAVNLLCSGFEVLTVFLLGAVFLELLWLMFRLELPKRVGAVLCGETVVIKTSKRLTIYESILARNKITAVTVSQNPFQKISGMCAVSFYINSHRLDIKNLKLTDAAVFAEKLKR